MLDQHCAAHCVRCRGIPCRKFNQHGIAGLVKAGVLLLVSFPVWQGHSSGLMRFTLCRVGVGAEAHAWHQAGVPSSCLFLCMTGARRWAYVNVFWVMILRLLLPGSFLHPEDSPNPKLRHTFILEEIA